jgi:hypothetical protein
MHGTGSGIVATPYSGVKTALNGLTWKIATDPFSVYAWATISGSRLFQAFSAALTWARAVSRVKGGVIRATVGVILSDVIFSLCGPSNAWCDRFQADRWVLFTGTLANSPFSPSDIVG